MHVRAYAVPSGGRAEQAAAGSPKESLAASASFQPKTPEVCRSRAVLPESGERVLCRHHSNLESRCGVSLCSRLWPPLPHLAFHTLQPLAKPNAFSNAQARQGPATQPIYFSVSSDAAWSKNALRAVQAELAVEQSVPALAHCEGATATSEDTAHTEAPALMDGDRPRGGAGAGGEGERSKGGDDAWLERTPQLTSGTGADGNAAEDELMSMRDHDSLIRSTSMRGSQSSGQDSRRSSLSRSSPFTPDWKLRSQHPSVKNLHDRQIVSQFLE